MANSDDERPTFEIIRAIPPYPGSSATEDDMPTRSGRWRQWALPALFVLLLAVAIAGAWLPPEVRNDPAVRQAAALTFVLGLVFAIIAIKVWWASAAHTERAATRHWRERTHT